MKGYSLVFSRSSSPPPSDPHSPSCFKLPLPLSPFILLLLLAFISSLSIFCSLCPHELITFDCCLSPSTAKLAHSAFSCILFHFLNCIISVTPAPCSFYSTYHSIPYFTLSLLSCYHSSLSPSIYQLCLLLHASITCCGDGSSPRHLIITSGFHFVLLLQPSAPPATAPNYSIPPPFQLPLFSRPPPPFLLIQ